MEREPMRIITKCDEYSYDYNDYYYGLLRLLHDYYYDHDNGT